MRMLAFAILFSYLQVVAHQVSHGDPHSAAGAGIHARGGHCNPIELDDLHAHGEKNSDPDGHGHKGHHHYVHSHPSLVSLAPRGQGADVSIPPAIVGVIPASVFVLQSCSLPPPATSRAIPKAPTHLTNMILRI